MTMKITKESVEETIQESWVTVATEKDLKFIYEYGGYYEVYRKRLLVLSTRDIKEAVEAYNSFLNDSPDLLGTATELNPENK